jgi:hypothetical protein
MLVRGVGHVQTGRGAGVAEATEAWLRH